MLIDRHTPGWIDILFEPGGPAATQAKGIHCYALIDCAFVPQCSALITHEAPGEAWQSLYQNAPGASDEVIAHSPILLNVQAMERPALNRVLASTDALPMLSFVHSSELLNALAGRLSRWSVVDADGQYYVLRFPDTRRLPDVLTVLRSEQLAAFCGSGVTWHFRARDARWRSFTTPEPGADAELRAEVPPALDGDQCAALIVASEPDELVAGLLHLSPAYEAQHTPSRLHALADRARALADAMSLSELPQRMSLYELLVQRPTLADTPNQEAAVLRPLLD